MFSNSDELLAEAFSNPWSAGILSMLESDTKTDTGYASYFRELMNSLLDLLKTVTKSLGLDIKPVANNYFSELTKFVGAIEKEVLHTEKTGLDDSPIELPESMLERIRLRLSSLHALTQKAGPKLNKLPPKLLKVLKYMAIKTRKNKTIQSAADVDKMMAKINAISKVNKLTSHDAAIVWAIIQKYRQELANAKTIQKNSLDYAKTHLPEYKESQAFKRDVDDFTSVDLDNLTTSQVRTMETGILDLVTEAVPDNKAYNIANKDKATKYLKTLLPTAGKYAWDPNILGFSLFEMANPATAATVLAKYNSPVAQKLFNTIYGGMLEAKTMSQTQANGFMNKLYDIAGKGNLNQRDYTRAHMYGVAFTTNSNPTDPDYWAEVKSNLDTIVQNSHNKLAALNAKTWKGATRATVLDEIKIAEELSAQIMRTKSMKGVLTTPQQKLYDTFREFITKHEKDATRNARGVWGDTSFNVFKNYIPTKALGRVDKGDLTGSDDLIPNTKEQELWKNIQGKKHGRIMSKQNGATKRRTEPKGYIYDYNLMSVANKYAAPLLFDIYATRELKSLNQLLNGITKPVSVGGKNIYSIMSPKAIEGLNYQLKNIADTHVTTDSETAPALRALFKAKDVMSTAKLATSGQFIIQASSAIPAAMIMNWNGFGKAMKVLSGAERGTDNFGTIKEFLEKNGLSIQLRDFLFERFQTVEDINAKGVPRTFGKVKSKLEESATYLLRSGDKFAARLVWFSAFFDAGGTVQKPTREAVLAAERAVGIMQNMSDVSFSAPMFKGNTVAKRMLMHMMFAFKSFSMNAAINTYYSGKYSLSSKESIYIQRVNVYVLSFGWVNPDKDTIWWPVRLLVWG